MKIRLYYNSNRKCYSIQTKIEGVWKVTEYSDFVVLKDPIFKVSEASRQRVLETKTKNVHAYILGWRILSANRIKEKYLSLTESPDFKTVRYNPYTHSQFYYGDKVNVYAGGLAILEIINKSPAIHILDEKPSN